MEHYGIKCPEWLMEHEISDDWLNSTYSFNDGLHEWSLGDTTIDFDGVAFSFVAVNPEDPFQVVEHIITEQGILKT